MILVLFSAHVNFFVDCLNSVLGFGDLAVLADVESEVVAE
jgi:hypothetical protein